MRLACLLPLTLLAACATRGPAPVEPQPLVAGPLITEPPVAEAGETCRGQALAVFIGEPRNDSVAKRLLSASGAKTLRWVAKGMMVTMDYRGDRLTVHLDSANRIERAKCG